MIAPGSAVSISERSSEAVPGRNQPVRDVVEPQQESTAWPKDGRSTAIVTRRAPDRQQALRPSGQDRAGTAATACRSPSVIAEGQVGR